jgi:hypothetical protein
LTSITLAILKRYKTLKSCCWFRESLSIICRKIWLRYLESIKKKIKHQASINSSRICINHLQRSNHDSREDSIERQTINRINRISRSKVLESINERSSSRISHFYRWDEKWIWCSFNIISYSKSRSVLRRSMTEKYSSKSIDDKRLTSIKSNLIYWSECWLFDVLQLTSIEIYLYSTIYEMNSFDVELDSYLSRSHVVRWISRNETLRESFSRTFVLRSFAHFVIRSLRIWAWSLNRWVRLIENLAEIIEQALFDLRETMRWLDVTYSYSKRKRNMILFLKITVSVIKQWTHWIWKTFFYWILFSNELLAWFFEFSLIVNLLIQSFEMKTSLRVRIRDEKTSWRSRLSFTIVNVFFHARNHAFFMREMLVFRTTHRENDHFDRFRI